MRFVPNDSLFSDQWYLLNVGQSVSTGQWGGLAGEDLNVLPVWERGITGQGVVIGIVDDGLQYDHPDLSTNYRSDLSIDIVDGDADPHSPVG
ncbi:MAG: S8 family serine peptidase [Elainellaceae cyanobacterium]